MYVCGPLKAFGDIKRPAWGAQMNGNRRFYCTEAVLHYEAPPADLFTPRAWRAVDKDNEAVLAFYKAAGGKPPERQLHIDVDLTLQG